MICFSLPTAKMAFALAENHGVCVRPLAAIVTITNVSTIIVYPAFIWGLRAPMAGCHRKAHLIGQITLSWCPVTDING